MDRRARVLVAAVALAATVGCVDRRYVVRTFDARDPRIPIPAQISVDGKPLGPAPLDASYIYTGGYQFHAVADGFQPLTQLVRFKPKWYDYPGLDLFAEVFWPFRIEDVREVNLMLQPARPLRPDELQLNADNLRARGFALPPTQIPEPPPKNPPPATVAEQPPVTGQPRPGPAPVVPNK